MPDIDYEALAIGAFGFGCVADGPDNVRGVVAALRDQGLAVVKTERIQALEGLYRYYGAWLHADKGAQERDCEALLEDVFGQLVAMDDSATYAALASAPIAEGDTP